MVRTFRQITTILILAIFLAAAPVPVTLLALAEATVYITRTGEKYHKDGCRYLSKSRIPISLSDAKTRGFGACSVCAPPR